MLAGIGAAANPDILVFSPSLAGQQTRPRDCFSNRTLVSAVGGLSADLLGLQDRIWTRSPGLRRHDTGPAAITARYSKRRDFVGEWPCSKSMSVARWAVVTKKDRQGCIMHQVKGESYLDE